ncbi:MAG TPA: response regulator [Candidatus Eisenbacteria bacterium]|nr:response regulator [Candidatus Eisenbacteria bacterium]
MSTNEVMYHGYVLAPAAVESASGSWNSVCRISWSTGRQELTLHAPGSFTSRSEAESHAIELGKLWVHNRLTGKTMTEKILIVEDEIITRKGLCELLRQEGYDVSEARDGAQAVEIIKRRRFDLVISDVAMPKLDGIQLVEYLRSVSPHTSIILLTGYLSAATAESLSSFVEVVEKPVALDALLSVVQRILG